MKSKSHKIMNIVQISCAEMFNGSVVYVIIYLKIAIISKRKTSI